MGSFTEMYQPVTTSDLGGTHDTLRPNTGGWEGGAMWNLLGAEGEHLVNSAGNQVLVERGGSRFTDDRVAVYDDRVTEMGWQVWYLMALDILSSMLIWLMVCYTIVKSRDNKGLWEACEAVEGGGTCTVLPDQFSPLGDLNEQLQCENSNRESVVSSLDSSDDDGRARIQNESNFISKMDHMDGSCGNNR